MLIADKTTHIYLDEAGVAWIDDTRVKVLEVVCDYLAHAWSPEEMAYQYPHLTLGQIHAAMAYYHDHRDGLDQQIEARRQQVEASRLGLEDRALRDRLQALKARR
jgi:uncharacterized protein (DUF433 family)